jgi:hypothetical protein
MGLNAEFLNQEWGFMPKKGTECRIGLGAEFSYAELDRIGRIPE